MSAFLHWLTSSQDYFRDLGWLGVLLFAGGIVIAQMFIAPLSPVAVAGGMIFGFSRGFLALELGTALGAVVNFLLSRYLMRGPFSRRLAGNQKFRLIDEAIGREGWKIVCLLRFVPMPFGLANYCYGLTAIPLVPYTIATVLAILPANIFITWFGATSRDALAATSGAHTATPPGKIVFTVVGLVAFFIALRQLTKIARRALAQQTPTAE